MKSPRIYTYKVTFEELPYFYWGVHKESKFNDGYLGSPVTHKWMWEFYTPHLQICEIFTYDGKGWIKAQTMEKRIIKSFLNDPYCLNENYGGTIFSLEVNRRGGLLGAAAIHEEKGPDGKSIAAVKRGSKGGQSTWEKQVGIYAPGVQSEAGKIGGKITSSQKWKSDIDGYVGSAANVVNRHNARGWDPNARTKLT